MGQVGNIVFHTDSPNADTRQLLRSTWDMMNVDAASLEHVPPDYDRWELAQRGEHETRRRTSLGRITMEEIQQWIDPAHRTCIIRLGSRGMPFARQLAGALNEAIPVEIAGEFVPCDPTLRIGDHDIYKPGMVPDENRFIGHATISLQLEGQTTPLDGPAYRDRIFEVDAIKEIRRRLEAEVGPVKQDLVFSV